MAELPIRVLPGVTAMLAAAASAGAPLGHDFCAINLSDNLKPWALIEKRLRLAAGSRFLPSRCTIRARPAGRRDFGRALAPLDGAGCGERLVIFARAVSAAGRADRDGLAERGATPRWPTCARSAIVGNSQTRRVGRWVYAPRRVRMTEPFHHVGSRSRPGSRSGSSGREIMITGRPSSAGGVDLGARAVAAGIAGDDPRDVARAHHLQLALERERAARHDHIGSEGQVRVRRIDETQR